MCRIQPFSQEIWTRCVLWLSKRNPNTSLVQIPCAVQPHCYAQLARQDRRERQKKYNVFARSICSLLAKTNQSNGMVCEGGGRYRVPDSGPSNEGKQYILR